MFTVLVIEDNPLHSKLFRRDPSPLRLSRASSLGRRRGTLLGSSRNHGSCDWRLLFGSAHGLDIVRAIRADDVLCRTPIIATSAFADEDERMALRALQCVAYVPKPVSVASLFVATVESVLNGTLGPPAPTSPISLRSARGHRHLLTVALQAEQRIQMLHGTRR